MEITKVQVHVVRNNPEIKVKAFCDIIIDGIFIVKGLAVREDHEGFSFVTMPHRVKDGVRIDITHPINEKCRQYIEKAVLDEYENVLNKISTQFDKMPYEMAASRPAAGKEEYYNQVESQSQ